GGTKDIGKRVHGVRTIYDLDARFRMMDEFEDYAEILSLGLPPIDAMAGPEQSPEFARIANDGLAELCAKYPDRFPGYVGALPMNAPMLPREKRSGFCCAAMPMGCSCIPTSPAPVSMSRASSRSSKSPRNPASRFCYIRRVPPTSPTSRRKRSRNTRSG